MANNEILIRVKVDDKGRLVEATKQTRALREEADRTTRAQTKLGQAAERAGQSQSSVNHAKNARDMRGLRDTIGSGNNGLVGAYATLAVNTFAVVAAFSALQKATGALKIMAGLEAQGGRLGKTLSITAGNIRNLTDNAVSMADAMRSTAQLTAGGFDDKQIQKLTTVARDASGALGRDLSDSMDRLSRGVTKLEPELLDELGIMTKLDEASNVYATANNKAAASLTSVEKRQAFMNAVLAEGDRKFRGIGEQVSEYDAYTRLAASASDVFVASIGGIAMALSPIVEMFAANKGLIVGALILYAATIREQLIPALSQAAAKQKELVAAKGTALIQNAKSFAEQAAAVEEAQKKSGRTPGSSGGYTFLPRAGAKELSNLAKQAEEGTVNLNDFRKAHVALAAQIENADDILRQASTDTEQYHIALANKDVLEGAQREVRGLTAAYYEQQAAQKAGNVLERAQNTNMGNLRENLRAMGNDLKGQFNNLQAASKPLDQATTRMGRAQQAVSGVAATAGNAFTVAGTGARAFGVMALNALPVIGQIVIALTLLKAAYDYIKDALTTDETRAYTKSQEELNTILDAAAEKQRNYNMLVNQAPTSAKAEVDALMLRGNAITEVTQKYLEVAEARRKADKSSIFGGGPTTVGGSEALGSVKEMTGNDWAFYATENGSALTQYQEGMKTLGAAISVMSSEEQAAVVQRAKSIAQISDYVDRAKQQEQLIKDVNAAHGTQATAVQNVQETYKNLEDSVVGFIQSADISTPVDKMVESLNKTTTATAELQLQLQQGTITVEEFGRTLNASLGAQSRNLLGGDISALLNLDQVQSQMKEIEKINVADRTITQQSKLVSLQADELDMSRQAGTIIKQRLEEAQALTRQAQIDYRLAKDRATLEDARYNRAKDLFQVGAQGYLAQQEHEEKMRASQVAQLDIQETLLKIMQTQAQATINTLKQKKEELQIDYLRLMVAGKITDEERTGYRLRINKATEQDVSPDVAAKWAEAERLGTQIAQIDISIKSAEEGMNQLGDSIKSLETQKAAILAQNLSAAEKAARAAGAEFEVSKKFFAQVREYADAIFNTNKGIRDFNRLIAGQNNPIRDQLTEIVETYQQTRESLIDELALKASQLDIDLQILQTNQDGVSLTEQGTKAAIESKEVAQAEYDNARKITEELLNQAEVQMRLKALQLAIYDTRKEGIEWQRQGYEWSAKQAALDAENAQTQNQIATVRRQNARTQRGLPDTDSNTRNEAIRAAADALNAAKIAYKYRVEGINAEYALLEAQKVMLQQELVSRRQILSLQEGISEDYLAPLDRAIDQLTQIDTGAMRNAAVEGENLNIRLLGEQLTSAVLAGTRGDRQGTYAARGQAMREDRQGLQDALKAAQEAANAPVVKALDLVVKDNNTGIKGMTDSVAKPLTAMLSTTDRMASNVQDIRNHVVGGGNVVGGGPMADQILAYLKSKGIDDAHAQGMLNNIKYESSFRPGADGVDSNGLRSSGLFQHNGSRGDAMRAFAGPDWATDWQNQIEYALSEADTQKYLKLSFPDAREASIWFTQNWERPANKVAESLRRAAGLGTGVVSTSAAGQQATQTASTGRMNVDTAPNREALDSKYKDASKVYVSAVEEMQNTPIFEPMNPEILVSGMERAVPYFNANMDNLSKKAQEFGENFDFAMEPLRKLAADLGPDGELIIAISSGISGMTTSMTQAFDTLSTSSMGSTEGITAMLQVASQAVSTISSILSAASDRKIRGIEQEIAAEQKRDGQSAASVAKIAEMEKRKDAIARKQFNTNKKMMMAQAVIATATGVTQALALPWPMNLIMAGVIGAMGAAQLAIIAGTSYQGGSNTQAGKVSIPKMSIGRVGDKVNLDRSNTNAGGEIGYLRGSSGYGTNASNYMTIGSATGGSSQRGYGHRSFLVGERGPETLETDTGMNIRPIEEKPVKEGDHYYIQATDADSFVRMLENNPEAIIKGVRKVANSNGTPFLESVDLKGFKATKR